MKSKTYGDIEFIFSISGAFALGMLLGWAFYAEPIVLSEGITWGSLGEWAAAAGTFVVGYGAWKYARATHLHTLERADAEQEMHIRAKYEALYLMNYKISGARSRPTTQALRNMPAPISIGVIAHAIDSARSETNVIHWEDGNLLGFSDEARQAFTLMFRYVNSFRNRCTTALGVFPRDSVVTELSETQERMLGNFYEMGEEMDEKLEAVCELITDNLGQMRVELAQIEERRRDRMKAFELHY